MGVSSRFQRLWRCSLKACRVPWRKSLVIFCSVFSLVQHPTITAMELVDESRYLALLSELRCPKCQHVNLLDSDAPIAEDLRATVRSLMAEGRSDSEIKAYLRARYGDFVLYDPPLRASTLLLWALPLLFAVARAMVVLRISLGSKNSLETSDASDETAQEADS
ncbi:MAG: cytochrome c-type biogenesis protein CcmH [Pseudomonadales bacterium]|nr:cytochrome c-type biogenesis protein CcmH [Pseudomonadales bacterium]